MRPPSSLSRRALLHGAVASAAAMPLTLVAEAQETVRRATMERAATAFLKALADPLRRAAIFPFADAERLNWHYVPRGRRGVPLKDMPAPARAAAHELMKSGLSTVGYTKATNVIRLEDVLRQIETFGGLMRDAEKYYVTVFGTPTRTTPWGWRVEGHHLSLNFTLVPDRSMAMTPIFFGANPATVKSGAHAGLRTLAEEQDLGLALARSVAPSLQSRFVIAADTPGDIVTGPGRGDSLERPAGVALGELTADQRELAARLIQVYVRTMSQDVADAEWQRIAGAGLDRVHFAWAGAIDPARPHYYRLHGPATLIEYDNTQGGANHIHTVWHTPGKDFGADLLAAHYEHGHRHRGDRS